MKCSDVNHAANIDETGYCPQCKPRKGHYPPREGDLPLEELGKAADQALKDGEGKTQVFMKFTCSHCGARNTFDVPNTFYTSGTCEDCGQLTQITHGGFMLVMTRRGVDDD